MSIMGFLDEGYELYYSCTTFIMTLVVMTLGRLWVYNIRHRMIDSMCFLPGGWHVWSRWSSMLAPKCTWWMNKFGRLKFTMKQCESTGNERDWMQNEDKDHAVVAESFHSLSMFRALVHIIAFELLQLMWVCSNVICTTKITGNGEFIPIIYGNDRCMVYCYYTLITSLVS